MNCLVELASKPSRLVAGAISGTSMDGIDVAICNIVGAGPGSKVSLVRFATWAYSSILRKRLRDAPNLGAQDVAELNVLVGIAFADAICEACRDSAVELIGSHGQTVYHHSRLPGSIPATLQVGDGDVIAERVGIPVVSDFRARDVAAGGEGAPLTPYADFILFGGKPERAVLNLGGIANLTVLGDQLEEVTGFDTGPANAPLDRIAQAEFGTPYDTDGLRARSGKYDAAVLETLLAEDTFISAPPPKSTGFEAYGGEFVAHLRALSGAGGEDLIRLATEFVVESVSRQVPRSTTELLVGGGGAENVFLRERLEQVLSPCKVRVTDDYGVPIRAREAIAFAILANDAICGFPTSLPRVTGASGARRLGKFSVP